MRTRISQRTEDVEELDHRPGPAVRDDQWQRVGLRRADVHDVNWLTVNVGHDVLERIQARFLSTPVETIAPIRDELAQVLELSALVPADPFDGVRKAGLAEARSKVVEVGVGNRDPERSELERHPVSSLVSRERGGPRSSRDNAATPVNPAQSARRLRRLRGACARMPTQGTTRSSPRHCGARGQEGRDRGKRRRDHVRRRPRG